MSKSTFSINIFDKKADYSKISNSKKENEFNMLASQLIGPEKTRPYVEYYNKKSKGAPNVVIEWIKDRIWNSVFFMGFRWLIPLYIIQVILLIFLEFDVIDNSILPVSTFLFDRVIGMIFGLLLGFTISNVANNSKTAMYSLIQNLHSGMSSIAIVLFSVLKEKTINPKQKTISITIYDSNGKKETKSSVVDIIIDQRHIITAYQYLVLKSAINGYEIQRSDMSMLPNHLYYEIIYLAPYVNNSYYLDRLLVMYNTRLDLLHRNDAIANSTQVPTYKQSNTLSTGATDVMFAGQDFNQPKPLIDILLVMCWILLLYYPLILFEEFSFFWALFLILIPDMILHGLTQFAKLYNDPYELALKDDLSNVNIMEMIHETVRNFDQQLIFIISTL